MLKVADEWRGVKIGSQFGRWEVIEKPFNNGRWHVRCRCECGTMQDVTISNLLLRKTEGCRECRWTRYVNETVRTHGQTGTRLYQTWNGMRSRCRYKQFKDYAGRGISVCKEWDDEFEAFYRWALANGYADHLEIDRIDNDGNYEPGNCRWVTRKQQTRNTRRNVYLTAFGETKTFSEWIEDQRCVVSVWCARHRIRRLGWEIELALTTPSKAKQGCR